MTRCVRPALLALVLAGLVLPSFARAQGPPPEVRRAVDALVAVLEAEDAASVGRFVDESLVPSLRATASSAEWAERVEAMRVEARGLTGGVDVELADPGLVVIFGGRLRVAVEIDAEGRFTRLEPVEGGPAPTGERGRDGPGIVVERDGEGPGIVIESDGEGPGEVVRRGGPGAPPVVDMALGDDWTDLPDLLERALEATGAPGLSVAVVRGGQVVDSAVAGIRMAGADEPIRFGDRFHWGSVGKSATGTVLGVLFERGVLSPETTVGEALPDVPMLDGYRAVTLAELMRHEAGVQPYTMFDDDVVGRFEAYGGSGAEKRAAFVADLLQEPPVHAPGERFEYSNGGVTLAGHIAEVATGRSWEELVRTHVFEPAGMGSGDFGYPATVARPDQPRGHFAFGPPPLEVMGLDDFGVVGSVIAPAGGISSSATDLARFGAMHLRGMREGAAGAPADVFRLLHTPDPSSHLVRNGTARYTWGWEVTEWPAPGIETHWHNGSGGAFYAELRLFPAEDLAIAVMSNAGGPIAFSGDQVVEALYRRYGREAVDPIDPDRPEWDALDAWFHRAAVGGFSGVVLARRNGREILRNAYGVADRDTGRPMSAELAFGLGSTPIDFTVATALILAERGELDLDAPVSRWLDGVPADKRALTPAMILQGRSGLADFHHTPDDADPDLAWISRDTAVARILSTPVRFEPGARREHSHSAYGLLAAIIEEVTGDPFQVVVRRELLDPLGMDRTGFYGEGLGMEPTDFAVGHGGQAIGSPNIPPRWGPPSWLILGSGGMFSTLADMDRFHRAWADGAVVGSDWMARVPFSPVTMGGSDRGFFNFRYTDGEGTELFLMSNREGPRAGTPELRAALLALLTPGR